MMPTEEPRRDRATRRATGQAEPPERSHVEDGGDADIVERLRGGDEAAFAALVDEHHASMIRLARLHVESVAAAEEVAQEAWLGVLRGLAGFEGRCSLKAWIFSIVANCARSRGARDKRTVPLSALAQAAEDGGAAVEPERFLGDGHPRWPGHWSQPPQAWTEDDLVSREALSAVRAAMETLPPMQRAVMTMRDVEGLGSDEACQVLGISEASQRVLLHRARSKVRRALEGYLREDGASRGSEQAPPPSADPERAGRGAPYEHERAGRAARCKPAASRPRSRERARSLRGAAVDELQPESPRGGAAVDEPAERSEAFR